MAISKYITTTNALRLRLKGSDFVYDFPITGYQSALGARGRSWGAP